MDDHDALHAARAVLGGRPLNLTTDEIFARLEGNPRFFSHKMLGMRREFDAMQIGVAVEAVEKTNDSDARLLAMLSLARTLRAHLSDQRPGWFRFLMAFGGSRGGSIFQLAVIRRPHSSSAQPQRALKRTTQSRRALMDMLIAGAILRRIETATASGVVMSVQAAIGAACPPSAFNRQIGCIK